MKKKLLYIVLFISIGYLEYFYAQPVTFYNPNADILAVSKGGIHQAIADLIRVYGADINTKNDNQQTPLMLAAIESNISTIESLLEFKPELDLQDNNGNTALILAINPHYPGKRISRNAHVVAQRLLEHGANPLIKNFAGKTALDYVTMKKRDDEWKDKTSEILKRYIIKFL